MQPGFFLTFEQCREKIKKLKAEYKKIKDKREKTGQGRYPDWEFFDALNDVIGQKHSTQPPVVVESMTPALMPTHIVGPDDETQDPDHMSGDIELSVPSPATSSTTTLSASGSNPDANDETQQTIRNETRKQGKNEVTNVLLERMVKLQENSDRMLCMIEEKRVKMEERQMELDAQLRREEREFQLQMCQILMRQNRPNHAATPPMSQFPMHFTYNYGGAAEFDLMDYSKECVN